SKSLAGDNFPLRDYANGRTDTIGLFIQDEIAGWSNGMLTLIPGLRYDWRRLKPDVDVLAQQFLSANNRKAVEQIDSSFSPKIAAIWKINSQWSLYGQAVRGFRAPNYAEVNSSFRNTVQSWGISPNPDLKPETSIGVEVGAKLHGQNMLGQLSVYDNRYKNFIDSMELNCPGDPSCISGLTRTNMFVNLSRVRIYGAELRGEWIFTPGWKLDSAIAWAHGDNESNSEPLNSVEPTRASLGLIRNAGTWGMETRLRGALAVSRTDDTDGEWYRPNGYVVTDVTAWWHPTKSSSFNVAVNNLFDKKYWLWSDMRQADSRNPLRVDFYSQPGRTLSASFTYDF
ncbi:MAG: TonB-dependent receptor, partial [Nitrosomonadales bacterium]|nr:TonB-dependent receptor [Nitrosomonadales bacterium]